MAIYYVSTSGSDTNNGTTTGTSWQTLAKVNATTFAPGDQILFNRGDTFYGTLSIKGFGAAGSPITFGAYGTGANPVITGFTTVTAWTNLGSNIWESTNAVSTLATCTMVVINGVNTPMGRYPNLSAVNGGYLTFQSHSGTTSITSSSLTGTPNWTGAEAVIRTSNYTFEKSIISSQSGGTLTFATALSGTLTDGFGFFIQNDSRTLDQQNEWYFNPTTKKIQVYSTTQPTDVKVASVSNLVEFAKLSYNYSLCAYINIENLSLIGSNDNTVQGYPSLVSGHTLHDTNIKNCTISFSGLHGISVQSDPVLIDGNTISETNGAAVLLYNSGNVVVTNNIISNCSLTKGVGSNYADCAILVSQATTADIEYNKITNCGFNGISFDGSSTMLIKYNYIYNFNKKAFDGGAITTGNSNIYGCKIIGNICINGHNDGYGTIENGVGLIAGIYLDDSSANLEVSNNTVANCDWIGLYLHNSSNNNIHDNIFYNNGYTQLRMIDDQNAALTQYNLINHNQFISKSPTQLVAVFSSIYDNLTSVFGTYNYNYYARPIDDNITISTNQPSTGTVQRNLSGWQSYIGQDVNSTKSPFSITDVNDLRFEYNETSAPKTVTLSYPMVDMKGVKYLSSVILQPYTSVVLLKDPNPPVFLRPVMGINGKLYIDSNGKIIGK